MSTIVLTPDDRLIRLPEVEHITGRKKSAIYSDPTFPRPIKLSRRESAWVESAVRAWMQARVDQATAAASPGARDQAAAGSVRKEAPCPA
jgi:prophage regulatory protein